MKRLRILFLLMSFSVQLLSAQSEDEPPMEMSNFSVWSQRIDMTQYVGKKYRLNVSIRAKPETNDGFAVAFIRNEYAKRSKNGWTFMDNMMNRPVRDSIWKTYILESTVEKKAPWIGFGMLGFGNGTYYFDDLRLYVKTANEKWIQVAIENANFENGSIDPWQQTQFGVPAKVLGASASITNDLPFDGLKCFLLRNKFLE